MGEPGTLSAGNLVAFPSHGHGPGYVIPARSRTGSVAGGEVTRKLLRTLSTVSIHESVEGLPGGLAGIAPIGKYIVQKQTTEADAPPSEMPRDFGMDADSAKDTSGEKEGPEVGQQVKKEGISMKKGKFQLDSA
jgi:mitogen-activated protein kinase 7